MHEVISGQPAYFDENRRSELNDFALPGKVIEGTRPQLNDSIPPNFQELMKRCWDKDPNKRPIFHELFLDLSLTVKDNETVKSKVEKILRQENETQEEIHNLQYCLTNVDIGDVMNYIDEITNSISKEELQSPISKIKQYENEIDELKNTINEYKQELDCQSKQHQPEIEKHKQEHQQALEKQSKEIKLMSQLLTHFLATISTYAHKIYNNPILKREIRLNRKQLNQKTLDFSKKF